MPTIVTRALVQRLAAETADDGAPPASETSPASGDAELAAARLLAAAVRGAPPTVDELRDVLPRVGQGLWGPLVGAATGDRVGMLLDLVELDRMSDEREAMALLLAAELSGKAPPARLRAELRKRLRREVSTEATVLQLAAAETLRDADVTELAKGLYIYVPIGAPKALASAVRQELRGPVLDVLPERAPPPVVSGFTARRVAPKIGRNDPCPCGSGKKYKKCCESKDAERAADPSPVPGMTRTEWLARGGATMSELDVDGLRADELALLDPGTLATGPLLVATRRLLAFHRWPEVERALPVLAARTDLKPGTNGDRYRQEVLIEALREGEREVAQRVLDAIEDHDDLLPDVRLSLAILDPSEDTLAELEDAALGGLEDPTGEEGVGLAYALLDHAPALGILVARGVLATERGHDAYELLDELEHARDRLGLPLGDPAGAQFDEYVSQSVRAQKEREALAGAQAERDRLMAEADELRRQVQRSNANVNELMSKLREDEARLAESKKQETKDDDARAAAPSPAEVEARRRLEQKVAEMKALISEGNRERAELRKKLTTTAESIDRATVPVAPTPEVVEEEEPAGAGGAVSQPRGLHVPAFGPSAQASLRKLPARVGKDALLAAASLGAGEVEGWHTVKQMQDIEPPLFSCRLGIHHRMLFRVGDGVLDVLEVLPREALDATLKRYR